MPTPALSSMFGGGYASRIPRSARERALGGYNMPMDPMGGMGGMPFGPAKPDMMSGNPAPMDSGFGFGNPGGDAIPSPSMGSGTGALGVGGMNPQPWGAPSGNTSWGSIMPWGEPMGSGGSAPLDQQGALGQLGNDQWNQWNSMPASTRSFMPEPNRGGIFGMYR